MLITDLANIAGHEVQVNPALHTFRPVKDSAMDRNATDRVPKTLRLVAPLVAAAMLACLSGCQTLVTMPGADDINKSFESASDKITVQIRPANRKAINTEVALKPDMRLQDLIDNSKAKFRHKKAYIVRRSPSSGERHKLEATFGPNRRISMETDYAIQPGDRVVISEDTTSSFDRVIQAMLGRS